MNELVKSMAGSLTVFYIFKDKKSFENFVEKFNNSKPEFKKGIEIEGKNDEEKIDYCLKLTAEAFNNNRGEYQEEEKAVYDTLNKYFDFKA
jgi:hypothetical protein